MVTTLEQMEALKASMSERPTFSTIIPNLRVVSESNQREAGWKRRHVRTSTQRIAAFAHGKRFLAGSKMRPRVVRLTRIAPRLLDSDNLATSLKAARDGFADALVGKLHGGDDSDRAGVCWTYAQEQPQTPRTYAVKIEVWM